MYVYLCISYLFFLQMFLYCQQLFYHGNEFYERHIRNLCIKHMCICVSVYVCVIYCVFVDVYRTPEIISAFIYEEASR